MAALILVFASTLFTTMTQNLDEFKEISDGTWIIPTVSGRGKKCYKKGEAADIYWEAVETAGFLAGRAIVDDGSYNNDY